MNYIKKITTLTLKFFFKKNFVNIYLFLKHILKNRVKRTTLAIKEQSEETYRHTLKININGHIYMYKKQNSFTNHN